MATLRETQKQLTRSLLLREGLELFCEKGYGATTIDDIASRAGTTRTTFYLHFGSKSDLMGALIRAADALFTNADDPPLRTVAASGDRALIERWIDRKLDQWAELRDYLRAAYLAAPLDPMVQGALDTWFEETIDLMNQGLADAGRFEPEQRRIRCVLAFGQLEHLARRWLRVGWIVPRQVCLETLTASWHHLLTSDADA